ncbi:MAG TPA: ribbon-helix-helix protein, CopG family [Candidatus Eisenbacteria bacterium]
MKTTITIRIDTVTKHLIEDLAWDTGRTTSEVVRQAIDEFVMPLTFRRMKTPQDRDAWLARRAANNWRPRMGRKSG